MTGTGAAPAVEPEQLRQVFTENGRLAPGAELGEIRVDPIGTGQMADTVRVTFLRPSGNLPASCVVKLPVGEGQTALTARHAAVYDREARFYAELRPEVPELACPESYGTWDVDGEPALVLEDISGAQQGNQIAGAAPGQATLAVDQLARYQHRWWNDDAFGAQDWLQRRAGAPIPERQQRYDAGWAKVLDSVASDLVDGAAEVIEEFGHHCDAWSQAYDGPLTLAHHDYRLDNMLFTDGSVTIVDWQTLGWGPPAWDLAYFMGTSLTVDERRAAERDLVARHAAQLRERGIDWSDAQAWDRYRQMSFSTFLLTVPAAGEVRTNDRARQMFVTMWNRAAQMVIDLDAREFLPLNGAN
ncbi:phosphotransferase [Nocardioides sp. AE5]|uniref:phosphotransferase family protein n=1 Tax=Nocardioides sp. AE5 TaxID=2962573 RepID=UPI00288142D0|nr:phosphotransferase [Nocardioides sp. AE5]MDT0201651.1 phosphotransferase [Nocardioides sp. AE5]